MNHIHENTYFSTDSVSVHSSSDDDESVTIDSVDSGTNWDRIPIETVDDARSAMFDTDQFHRFETVVARPIEQEYSVDGDETLTFKKPADELRKAQSSLHNAPFTLGHPSGGRVTDSDQIKGYFWDAQYDNINDSLTADLYVPVDDEQAHEQLAKVSDVSMGFYHELDRASAMDDIDGRQRDLVIDHVAAVESGRCSSEDGCEIVTDCAGGTDCGCGVPRVPLENLHIDDVHETHKDQFERAVRDEAQSRHDWRDYLIDHGIAVVSESDSGHSQDPDDESVPQPTDRVRNPLNRL